MALKRTKYHPNDIKMILILMKNIMKIAQRLGALPPHPPGLRRLGAQTLGHRL